MTIVSHQVENINKQYKLQKNNNNQIEILELKSATAKMKTSLKGLNNEFRLSEERINKLEDRLIVIINSQEKNFLKRTEPQRPIE